MKVRVAVIVFGLGMAGCASSTKVAMVDAIDPRLTQKLGLAEEDWRVIERLASDEKGWMILRVTKVSSDVIEVWFKRPDDRASDRGGPVRRYERERGAWNRSEYESEWAVHLDI